MVTHFAIFEELWMVFLLTLPLIVGGIIHMFIVKRDTLSYLKKPIHHSWFGANKTWRGFVVMPLATWPGVLLSQSLEKLVDSSSLVISQESSWILAIALGWAYCLAELPNSFIKRKMGIAAGKTAEKNKLLFVVMDQADSAFGCLLAYKVFLPISWQTFWLTILLGTLIHLIINRSLYILGIRKNPY